MICLVNSDNERDSVLLIRSNLVVRLELLQGLVMYIHYTDVCEFFRNINLFFRIAIQNYTWSSELYLAFPAFSHNLQVLNRGNIFRYIGGIFTGIQGEYLLVYRGKYLQVYRGNVYRYTGGIFTGIQGEYLQIYRGNIYRYTEGIFSGIQGEYLQVYRGIFSGILGEYLQVYRGNIYRYTGGIFTGTGGIFTGIQGKYFQVYRGNIYMFTGIEVNIYRFTGIQGEYFQVYRGNIYRYTGGIFTCLQV